MGEQSQCNIAPFKKRGLEQWGEGNICANYYTGSLKSVVDYKCSGKCYGIVHMITNDGTNETNSIDGIIFCKNPSGYISKGINPITIDGVYKESSFVVRGKGSKFTERRTFQGQDLQRYVAECPNPNWTVIDFVPIKFASHIYLIDTSNVVKESLKLLCRLPKYETLKWNEVTNSVENKYYTCTILE